MASPYTPQVFQAFVENQWSLKELIARFPEDWERSDHEMKLLLASGGAKAVVEAAQASRAHAERIAKSGSNPEVVKVSFPHLIRTRMMTLALKNYSLAAQTKTTGRVAFDQRNGELLQGLLFADARFTRKPVDLAEYERVWPLVTQQAFLMPLVNKKGIYCFYSQDLIRELNILVAGRTCVEVGAGDGTLSRFLNEAGVAVRATDNYSWSHFIEYPAEVEKLDAHQALKKYRPAVVLCSWPDPENQWEQTVFDHPAVQVYVVIGSSTPGVTGNPAVYQSQWAFTLEDRPDLAALVLPREQGNAVKVFRRKA